MAASSRRGDALRSPASLFSRVRSMLSRHAQRRNCSSSECGEESAAGVVEVPEELASAVRSKFNSASWRKVDSRKLGINRKLITNETWVVLRALQRQGHQAYLVGGCVRDLILKRAPKDFDVITTATLKEVRRQFHRSKVVGSRFPICQVHVLGSMVEVSSFGTTSTELQERLNIVLSTMPNKCKEKDMLLWKNSMERDFTVNSLFFNPLNCTIYDFANGLRDISRSMVCTVTPADFSFKEDCARILRALRIGARLGFQFSKETASAIQNLSSSVIQLSKARLMMELDYMLSYGAAESSVRLLQKYGFLDMLLPLQAGYLADQLKDHSNNGNIMLLKLFRSADALLAADRPCQCNLWLALLAFHLALTRYPQNASAVLAFAAVLYFGSWGKAMEFLKSSNKTTTRFAPEILNSSEPKSDKLLMEETSLLAEQVKYHLNLLASEETVHSPAYQTCTSNLAPTVIVSTKQLEKVFKLFDVIGSKLDCFERTRQSDDINYKLLKNGDSDETRFVLGRIILDTMYDKCTASTEIKNSEASEEPHSAVTQGLTSKTLDPDSAKKTGHQGAQNTVRRSELQELARELPLSSTKDFDTSCGLDPALELDSQQKQCAMKTPVLLSAIFRQLRT